MTTIGAHEVPFRPATARSSGPLVTVGPKRGRVERTVRRSRTSSARGDGQLALFEAPRTTRATARRCPDPPPMPRRVLVAGSPDWPNDRVGRILEHLQPLARSEVPIVLVHGGAIRGVDAFADSLWREWGMPAPEVVAAPWDAPCLGPERIDPLTGRAWCPPGHRKVRWGASDYCPQAEYRRNQHAVDLGADAMFAFILNDAPEASDWARRSEAAGIATTRIELVLPIRTSTRPAARPTQPRSRPAPSRTVGPATRRSE